MDRVRYKRGYSCPVCGGHDGQPRGKGIRCHGFASSDGRWAHCSREERAGALPVEEGSRTYAHVLSGQCRCGIEHGAERNGNSLTHEVRSPRVLRELRYPLSDNSGVLVAEHIRRERDDGSKCFSWCVPGHKREGLHGLKRDSLPLYGLPGLLKATKPSEVIVTEGEKKRDVLRDHGFLAVGIVTGADGTPEDHVLQPLIGHHIFLWPDNDHPGRAHMQRLAQRLAELGVTPRIVNWPGAGEKEDAADFFSRGGTVEGVKQLLAQAVEWASKITPETHGADGLEGRIRELATLPILEYERRREREAKSLGVRVTVLDQEVSRGRPREGGEGGGCGHAFDFVEPEIWREPVNGAELLDQLTSVFRRFVVLPESAAEAIALWIVFTFTHDAFSISPRLAVTSPEKRCGKSKVQELLACLTSRPLPTSNITAAALFRVIEAVHPTLLIDEVDSFLGENEELRGILNSGHTRSLAFVIRTVGEDFEPRRFTTWAPVSVALIGRLPDTLEDRSIHIQMRRKRSDEKVERLRRDRAAFLGDIVSKVARWAKDHFSAVASADPETPAGLHDRATDNWRPLLAIADAAGGEWPTRARSAAVKLSGGDGDGGMSLGGQLLADIQRVFAGREVDRLSSKELCDGLAVMEDRPWPEWRHGKPITPRQLAGILGRYGVSPKTVRIGQETPKGYELKAFQDAFSRYLPSQSATTQQADRMAISVSSESILADLPIRNNGKPVADREMGVGHVPGPDKPDCGGVAAQTRRVPTVEIL